MIQTNYSKVEYLLLSDNWMSNNIAVIEVQPGEEISKKVTLAILEDTCTESVTLEDVTLESLDYNVDIKGVITDDDDEGKPECYNLSLISVYQ